MSDLAKIGGYLFILGVLLAVVAGVVTLDATTVVSVLVVLGLIVGFLNISEHEAKDFLMASVALVIVAGLGGGLQGLTAVPTVGPMLIKILGNIMVFVMPAVVVVALRMILMAAKEA